MVVSWVREQRWIDSCDGIREIIVWPWLVLLRRVDSCQVEEAEEYRVLMLCLWLGLVKIHALGFQSV